MDISFSSDFSGFEDLLGFLTILQKLDYLPTFSSKKINFSQLGKLKFQI